MKNRIMVEMFLLESRIAISMNTYPWDKLRRERKSDRVQVSEDFNKPERKNLNVSRLQCAMK